MFQHFIYVFLAEEYVQNFIYHDPLMEHAPDPHVGGKSP